jgi:hypothetical protein
VKEEENAYLAGRLKGSGTCMINQEGGGKEYCRQYLVDGLSWPFKHAFEPT